MWTKTTGWLIAGGTGHVISDVGTAGDCKRLCTEANSTCLSVNYQSRAASKVCELLSVRSTDVGNRWVESTDEQGYDYYEYQLVNGESYYCCCC